MKQLHSTRKPYSPQFTINPLCQARRQHKTRLPLQEIRMTWNLFPEFSNTGNHWFPVPWQPRDNLGEIATDPSGLLHLKDATVKKNSHSVPMSVNYPALTCAHTSILIIRPAG
jgi:hypothetical protein